MLDAFEYLESLNENKIELGLDRIKKVLNILHTNSKAENKSSHRDIKVIQIAGTNGKGSTANFINNILINDCLDTQKIGLFTSPHILKINERIKINNIDISDNDFKKYINYFKILLTENSINLTYFEFLTVIAIKYFCDNAVDIAIFECGLGGRLDSTNVFEKPLVSVITNIDFDHTEYLGNTLDLILTEKMGIFRVGVPIVSGVTQKDLIEKIIKKSKNLNSDLFLIDRDFFIKKNHEKFSFVTFDFEMADLELKIRGEHQYFNLAIVLMIIRILKQKYGYKFKADSDIKNTINNFVFNGRLEFISSEKNRFGTNFILDVGHNLAGIQTCMQYLKSIKKDYKNLAIVFGMLKDKDYENCITEILKTGDFFYLTSPKSKRALKIFDILQKFNRHKEDKKVKLTSEDYLEILKNVDENFGEKDLVCIVGSFYLISDFKFLLERK